MRDGPPWLTGRRALITGGAGALGSSIAVALHAAGASLLLVDIDEVGLDAIRERLGCEALVADLATEEGLARIVSWSQQSGGGVDILINNAGVERVSPFDALSAAEVRRALEVNLVGAMLLTHALLPAMRRRGRAHIVTVSSMAGIKHVPYNTVYNTAKAALVGFSMSLSKELAGSGVDATVVCPSAVSDMGMWARSMRGRPASRLIDASAVSAEDVVRAVMHALVRRPRRVLVASGLVRAGALLSALSPWVDSATDKLSRIGEVYRRRIDSDRDNRL